MPVDGVESGPAQGHFSPRVIELSMQKQYRDFSLHGLIRAAFQMHGMSPPNRIQPDDLRTLADLGLRANTSTYDLPGMLTEMREQGAA